MNFIREHWDEAAHSELTAYLNEIAEQKHLDFQSKLVQSKLTMLGIKLPVLKVIAKEIAKGNYAEFLAYDDEKFYEEVMLKGFVIGFIKGDFEEVLPYIREFIPKIDNWAVCDSFCVALKITKKNTDKMFDFIGECVALQEEYTLRFAAVMLLDFYITDEYIDRVLQLYNDINFDAYYVKMAVAWGLSFCLVKYFDRTVTFLKGENSLDKFTYNKALQKAIESYRITDEQKSLLRGMKM